MALTYEELFKIQKEREEKERASGQRQADVAPVYVNPGLSSFSPSLPSAPTSFSPSNPVIGKPKITVPTIAPIGRNYFDDGYDFGDVTKSILGIASGVGKTIGSSLFGSQQSKKPTISAFDNSLMQKYSTMSLADIEREYSRVEKEEELFKNANGGKAYNYLAKLGAGAFVGSDQSGNALSSHGLAKANIDKLNDFAREKEIISMFRKQKATEELLGGLSEEQLKLLDNIAEGKASEDIAPFYLTSQGVDANTYYKTTEVERTAGKVAREKLQKQLKDKNPDKNEEELNELIDNMVELRKSQRNADEQAATQEQIKAQATEHPVASFLASRFTNLLGGPLGLSELYMQRGNEYGLDTNAPGFALTNASNTIDEQVQLDHDWKIGEVDAFDLFYEAGTGIVDNVARLAISGGNTTVASAMMFPQITTQSIIEGKKKGYSDSKALALGLLNGTFEAVSEKLSLDAILGSKGGVLKKLAKSFAAEGSEEVTSSWLNRIADQIANGKHSELSKQYNSLLSEGYTESQALAETTLSVIGEDTKAFVISGIAGTVLGSGNIAVNAVSNVAQKNAPVELDEKAQTVVDKIVEEKIAEAVEKNNGKAISKYKQKQIRESVIQAMDKGYIDKESIYSEFGGAEYENYKEAKDLSDSNIADGKKVIERLESVKKGLQAEYDTLYKMKNGEKTDEQKDRQSELKDKISNIDAEISKISGVVEKLGNDTRLSDLKAKLDANVYEIVKDSRLAETFRESDRGKQAFSADTEQYKNEFAKKTVQNAIDYGVNTEKGFNNTNAAHDFVDFAANIASDKKVEIVFTNTEGLAKLKEGKNEYNIKADPNKINAFISEEHNKMFINMDTHKSLQSLVGHKITHTTEKAKSYDNVADLVKSVLGEEEFNKLVEKKTEAYKGLNLKKDAIEKEVVADFIGDRLFTDHDFIKRLSVEHRNIFQQIWDEVKYLCKVATAGSKEARELEKLKHQFEKAYKESAKSQKNTADGGVKYMLSKDVDGNTFVDVTEDILDVNDGKSVAQVIRKVISERFNNLISVNGQNIQINKTTNDEFRRSESAVHFINNPSQTYTDKLKTIANADEILYAAKNWIGEELNHERKDDIVEFARANVMYRVGENGYVADVLVGIRKNGAAVLYDLVNIYDKEITEASVTMASDKIDSQRRQNASVDDILPQNSEKSSGNVDYSLNEQEVEAVNTKLNEVGYSLDAKSGTVSYSLNSLEEAFSYKTDKNGVLLTENDYLKSRNEYVNALANSIAAEKGKPTREEYKKADRYLDSLFLIHDLIASDRDRLDYEAAPGRKAWVGNVEYGGSIDFSTLCAKRRLFTGTFDAIQNALPDTVLTDKDFLNIRKLLLEHGEESPCSMCYVEGSRAKHGQYVDKWLKEYLKTNPDWKPQIADFTSTTRLEQTRIQHPEAYAAYVQAMNKLSQRKPKEASVRTDYKGEILDVFGNGESVEQKNLNGGIRFNSFSDFEIIHALDCMQVLTDMSRVGLNGQAYTKVKEFAEAFGNTGLKINLSLVAKDVDANGKLVMDEVNGMNYAEAKDIRSRHSDNVGTVIVVFNDEQLKAALSDDTIDFVLPFHRSQWRKSQYALMGLPDVTRDYTNIQNDRYKNPKTGRAKKAPEGNIMPNEYWDFSLSGRENAQKYLDYINENSYIPKFDFLLNKVDGKWVLPDDAVGDGYFKLLIDFKMYNNEGVGSPQNPVLPEFNMPYIQQMLENYKGGHQAFPVANDVVDEFVEGKKSGRYSLSDEGEIFEEYGNFNTYAKDITLPDDIAPVKAEKKVAPARKTKTTPIQSEELLGMSQIGSKAPDKKSGIWSDFVRNFVSKGAVFETTALKKNNRALEDKYKMWKDRSEAKAQYFMENGNGDVKSLKSIVDKAKKSGLYKEFDLYLAHVHNMSRMLYDKPVFGSDVTGDMSLRVASKLQKQHPEFKEWSKDLYKYNDYLLQKTVDGGLISQEFADELALKYPNYVPIERITGEDGGVNADGVFVGNPIKTAIGGNQAFESPLKAMAHRTTQVFKAVDKNAFGVELMNTIGGNVEATGTNTEDILDGLALMDDSLLQPGKDGKNPTFTVFENGERVTFDISEEMYKALQPTTEAMSREHKIASVPSKLHKKVLTEYNLFFTARNFPKDAQEVIINSKHPAKTYANMPKAVSELITGGKYATEYWENGGKSNTYFDGRENDFSQDDGIVKKAIGLVPNGISKINDFVEAIPRLAEYIASRKKGATIEASMLDAARVTTDFSDGGDITKFMNRNGFTFLNASVQGFSQQVRNVRQAKAEGLKGTMKLVGKYALSGLPALLFNQLMWDDDEEYENLSEYVKDSYYVVAKYGDGQFVRIPKGRTAAVIQEAVDQVCDLITSDEVNWDDVIDSGKSVYESFMSNIAPNNPLDNNVIAPIKQAISGTAWYGDDIVPTRLQDLPAKEQFDESTDSISKWLGEKTGISPYKINYLLNQYSGFVGDIVLPPLTPEAERGDGSALGNLLAPLKDQFVVDATIKNRNPSDFYTLSDELEVKANSKNATDEDRVKSAYITNISYEMGDLYKQKREIQNSDLPDDEKFLKAREIQSQINEMAKNALDTYEDVKVDGKYATVNGIPYKYLEDKGKWYELYDNEIEDQKFATEKLGITPGEYWSDKKAYDAKANKPGEYAFAMSAMGSYDAYNEMHSGLWDIRADKDENGNSISGTAKSKKKDYIWNLDIDEGAKHLLFRSEYSSYNDYNYEIMEYVDGLSIPYEDKVRMLEFAGFTVRDDGYVSW